MTISQLASYVDHTLLQPAAKREDIDRLCREALEYKTASVCISPSYVAQASELLEGRIPVCTVVGFPLGAASTAAKRFETKDALSAGASEIDMVIHIGRLKDGDFAYVHREISALKAVCEGRVLKVIVETCLLTRQEKIKCCRIVGEAGADFIKTSTGFSTGGATFEDIELMHRHLPSHVKIKASGGIRSLEDMEMFIRLGASRLGTSSAIRLFRSASL